MRTRGITGDGMSDTATLNRLFGSIEADLRLVDRAFEEATATDMDMLASAVVHVLGSQGKRLRMALALLTGKLIDYRFDKLLPMSVALEMVHLATLVHDDVVDAAQTRRGLPTVNALFGNNIAILLGDYLFAKTAGLVAQVEDFRIDRLFSETVARVCEGTIMEMLSVRKVDLSVPNYIDRVGRKTAVLMSACCKGGAIVAGGTDAQIALMERYGMNLGIAFQVIDDVLDYTGTEVSIGKPAGNDLRQGLMTLPLIYALQVDQDGRLDQVRQLMRQEEPDEDILKDVIAWVNTGSGGDEALDLARHYAARARAALAEFDPSPERTVLEELIEFVLARSR
jgi:heptaprenyl diphosphate synthase